MGMSKKTKKMYKVLEEMVGEYDAGLLIAILCDSLQGFVKGSPEGRKARTIEIKLNNFFSLEYNFATGEYKTFGIN